MLFNILIYLKKALFIYQCGCVHVCGGKKSHVWRVAELVLRTARPAAVVVEVDSTSVSNTSRLPSEDSVTDVLGC